MIGMPLNDRKCLGQVSEVAANLARTEDREDGLDLGCQHAGLVRIDQRVVRMRQRLEESGVFLFEPHDELHEQPRIGMTADEISEQHEMLAGSAPMPLVVDERGCAQHGVELRPAGRL